VHSDESYVHPDTASIVRIYKHSCALRQQLTVRVRVATLLENLYLELAEGSNMATVDGTTAPSSGGKTATVALESGGGRYGGPAPAKCSGANLALRALLFAVSLSALVVLVTAKQTVMVPFVIRPPQFILAPVPAKYTHSPALIYLLAALCATCFYSLITAISSVRLLSSSACSAKTLFYLILLDVVSSLCMRKLFQHGICMHGYRTTTALAIVNYPVK
jgi:hypothetical protein